MEGPCSNWYNQSFIESLNRWWLMMRWWWWCSVLLWLTQQSTSLRLRCYEGRHGWCQNMWQLCNDLSNIGKVWTCNIRRWTNELKVYIDREARKDGGSKERGRNRNNKSTLFLQTTRLQTTELKVPFNTSEVTVRFPKFPCLAWFNMAEMTLLSPRSGVLDVGDVNVFLRYTLKSTTTLPLL